MEDNSKYIKSSWSTLGLILLKESTPAAAQSFVNEAVLCRTRNYAYQNGRGITNAPKTKYMCEKAFIHVNNGIVFITNKHL